MTPPQTPSPLHRVQTWLSSPHPSALAVGIVLALAQFGAAAFSELTGLGGSISNNVTPMDMQSPEVPPGAFFAIWGVIFLLSAVYAVGRPIFRKPADVALYAALWPATTGLFALSSVWMLLAQLVGDGWHLVIVIWAMWGLAFRALRLATQASVSRWHGWVTQPLMGLYTGWLSVAVFLNTSSVLKPWVLQQTGLSLSVYAVALLALAVVFSAWVAKQSKGLGWYGLAVLWAIVGIAIRAQELNLSGVHQVAIAVGIVWVLWVGWCGWVASRNAGGNVASVANNGVAA